MARPAYTANRPRTTGNPLQTLSPKTIAAIVLMALMAVLWLRVLTRGQAGPSAAQAAVLVTETATTRPAAPLRVTPVDLPVIEGRHDSLRRDFFSPDNWPAFRQVDSTPPAETGLSDRERLTQQHKAIVDNLAKTLNLDAILNGADGTSARVCIDGKVLTQGQALLVKRNTETYELTVSEIGEHQVVLTWNDWSVVLKMTQPERVD